MEGAEAVAGIADDELSVAQEADALCFEVAEHLLADRLAGSTRQRVARAIEDTPHVLLQFVHPGPQCGDMIQVQGKAPTYVPWYLLKTLRSPGSSAGSSERG